MDIRSGHPVAGSNTYFLYKSGYNGILIDPLKSNAELTKKFRPLDRFILAAVSSHCRALIFYEFDPYQLSTFDENVYGQRVEEGVLFIRNESIPMITIASLRLTNNPDVQFFLSVHTKGFEMQVKKGIDFSTLTRTSLLSRIGTVHDLQKKLRYFHFLLIRAISRVRESTLVISIS